MRGVAIHLSYTHRTVSSPSYLNQYLSNSKKNTANRTARSEYPPHGTPTPLQRPVVERQTGAGFHRPAWHEKRANFRQRRVPTTPTTTQKEPEKKNRRAGLHGPERTPDPPVQRRTQKPHRTAFPHCCYPAPAHAQPGTQIITRPAKIE